MMTQRDLNSLAWAAKPLIEWLTDHCRGRKCAVYVNSSGAELITGTATVEYDPLTSDVNAWEREEPSDG